METKSNNAVAAKIQTWIDHNNNLIKKYHNKISVKVIERCNYIVSDPLDTFTIGNKDGFTCLEYGKEFPTQFSYHAAVDIVLHDKCYRKNIKTHKDERVKLRVMSSHEWYAHRIGILEARNKMFKEMLNSL